LWLGEKHREGLATLKYGIMDNRGFLLFAGDVGTGKTTLINALVNSLGDETIVANVTNPSLEKLDLFNFIAHSFKLKKKFRSKGEFLIYFSHFLHRAYAREKKVLLIIDEAHRLSQELLEEIRLLSNVETHQTKLINIFLVGQYELNDVLLKPENRALRQRITMRFSIEALNRQETEKYIVHRLKVAGAKRNLFNSGALKKIYSFSKGNPRLINVLCDHALLSGYVKDYRTINASIVSECIKDLKISSWKPKESARRVLEEKRKMKAKKNGKPLFKKLVYATGLVALGVILLLFLYFIFQDRDSTPSADSNVYSKEINPSEDSGKPK
jgi:general secretion pathway protein A